MTEAGPALESYAAALADGIEEAIPGWVSDCVRRIMSAWDPDAPPEVTARAEAAAREAQQRVGALVRLLLMSDIDEQRTTPLALLRQAVCYPTEVLRAAGVPPVERDDFSMRAFPGDDYDLTPSSLADVSPGLVDLGISWGAAKAFEHKRRHGGRD